MKRLSIKIKSGMIYLKDIKYFEEEKNHLEKFYNYTNLKLLNKFQIKDEIQSNIYESGLINYGSYHINPLKFLLGIGNQIKSTKIKVFENTPITKIIEHNDSIYCYSNLKKIKSKINCPIITDLHTEKQCQILAENNNIDIAGIEFLENTEGNTTIKTSSLM